MTKITSVVRRIITIEFEGEEQFREHNDKGYPFMVRRLGLEWWGDGGSDPSRLVSLQGYGIRTDGERSYNERHTSRPIYALPAWVQELLFAEIAALKEK